MASCNDPTMGAMLHAYELGILSEEEAKQFEIHLMSCERCRTTVAEFEEHAAILRDNERVGDATRRSLQAEPEESLKHAGFWSRLWPEAPLLLKPGLIYIALVAVSIPAIVGVRTMVGRQDLARPAQALRLVPNRTAEAGAVQIKSGLDGVVCFGVTEIVPGKGYDVLVSAEDGQPIFHNHRFTDFDAYGFGNLVIPSGSLRPGGYRLVVTDPDVTGDSVVAEYRFRVVK